MASCTPVDATPTPPRPPPPPPPEDILDGAPPPEEPPPPLDAPEAAAIARACAYDIIELGRGRVGDFGGGRGGIFGSTSRTDFGPGASF